VGIVTGHPSPLPQHPCPRSSRAPLGAYDARAHVHGIISYVGRMVWGVLLGLMVCPGVCGRVCGGSVGEAESSEGPFGALRLSWDGLSPLTPLSALPRWQGPVAADVVG